MAEQQAKFRILKKGYDRFAVDNEIDRLTFDLSQKEQQLTSYMKEAQAASEQLLLIKERYHSLMTELNVRGKAADDIARLALREANAVIASAQNNADTILKEALSTAKMVLVEIARLSNEAKDVKADMKEKLEVLTQSLEAFKIPSVPALKMMDIYNNKQDAPQFLDQEESSDTGETERDEN